MMKVKKPSEKEIALTESWSIWSKEPSVFQWYYDDKETCLILEGNAVVTGNDGSTISFGPGDWVEFEKGLECKWKIDKAIKKRYKFG
ncbi:MAG: cupin domain-containing protein [Bacteroidales bacterium]